MEDSKDHDNWRDRHLTTRRGFVTSVGFGVVSLYGLWAFYGAAPVSLAGIPGSGEGDGGSGGHGGGGGMSPEEFRRLTEAFIEANELPDGSVQPERMSMAAMDMNGGVCKPDCPHEETVAGSNESSESGAPHDSDDPIDVYILTQRYSFEPDLLRLERNVPYRFRMMAMDTTHGVSVLGSVALGGHIMRARPQTLSEMTMTFTRPGEHLVYCTVYCGEGHDMMQAKIIVA